MWYPEFSQILSLIWEVVAPLIIVEGIKARGVSKRAGAELSSTHVFPALMCLQHLCVSSTLWLNSGYHIIKSYFWHRANFELKYLWPQMGYKKVMVLAEKVCSSRFRNTPDFYSYLNSKGLYGSPKSKILFFGTPCISVRPQSRVT